MGIFPSLVRHAVPIALAFLALGLPCRAQDLDAGEGKGAAAPLSPVIAAAPAEVGGSPGRKIPILVAELGAGPLVGLDRPLRGGELSAALLLDLGAALGPGFSGLMPGLEATVLYDFSFKAAAGCADLVFSLGPELRFALGCEAPLGSAALDSDGTALALAPGAWPNRFAVAARLGDLGNDAEGSPGPRVSIEAELGWSAYRLADPGRASRLDAAQSGIRGFSAGFRMGTLLRLRWGSRR